MLPKVAIVGRPNVGKSSLLNLLAGRLISIVDPTAGVTRDRITCELALPPATKDGPERWCEVMDTGGYGVYSDNAEYHVLTEDIERQIGTALDQCNLILFIVDARAGITPLDKEVAQLIRKRISNRVPILLIANKVDDMKHEADAAELARLGFGQPLLVSAQTSRGKWEFIEAIANNLDWDAASLRQPPRSEMMIAIVGKRNAGKSTFVNALAGSERVIASELPGTTRDSVDVKFAYGSHEFTAIDTAGLRRGKSVENDVEYYSMHRTLRSIRRADVVLLMVDVTTEISQVDQKLSQEIQEHYKPAVIVLNKWDLVERKKEPEEFLKYVDQQLKGLGHCPLVFTSAINNDHVHQAIELAVKLHKQASTRIDTSTLNETMEHILAAKGPHTPTGSPVRIYYVTQVQTNPPTVVLFVNNIKAFDNNYQRYLVNAMREAGLYEEVPIKLVVRPKKREQEEPRPGSRG
ncbi:MAG: ribosome biogenesis GTPase Der [Phycisphaerales bacterium]